MSPQLVTQDLFFVIAPKRFRFESNRGLARKAPCFADFGGNRSLKHKVHMAPLTEYSAKCLINSNDRDINVSLAFGNRVLCLELSALSASSSSRKSTTPSVCSRERDRSVL